tara:strand:+ start:1401 stop:1766 length:366 start_codon:yes stop_codon:yes gene_type:complete
MPISNQKKSKQSVKDLICWLDSNPEIPIYNGRINKTAICKQLKISRSTVSSNMNLKAIFEKLESDITNYNHEISDRYNEKDLRKIVRQLEKKLAKAEDEILTLKGQILADEFLLQTGRVIQ